MEFKELVTPSLTELFIKEMEHMILSGELKIGDRLPTERELSEHMKVSRAVINGGLNQLSAMGFLRVAPRKGVFVNDYIATGNIDVLTAIMEYNGWRFTPEYLEPILQFRMSVEPYCMELAALNSDARHQAAIFDIVTELKNQEPDSVDPELIFTFYHTIAIAGGNIILPLILNTFKPVYVSIGRVIVRLGNAGALIEDFEHICNAIADHNIDAAKSRDLKCIEECRRVISSHYRPGDYFAE